MQSYLQDFDSSKNGTSYECLRTLLNGISNVVLKPIGLIVPLVQTFLTAIPRIIVVSRKSEFCAKAKLESVDYAILQWMIPNDHEVTMTSASYVDALAKQTLWEQRFTIVNNIMQHM